ncbi:MAG TPA: DUF3891 family protein [Candidatus Eisenbacteria bacterium]|nr:DUF3891 family protein [Candidatus Eisenbacteria bacterium]
MMVNRYDESRLLLALQIDHSRVAGFLAAHWGNDTFAKPRPYASVVLAAQEHDSGWWEWEMKPATLNDQGYPLDYHDGSLKYLGQLRLDFYKRAVERVAQRDPYAALLISLHGVGLMNAGYGKVTYPPDRSADPRVQDYIRHEDSVRIKLTEACRRSEEFREFSSDEQVWTNYELIEVFDQLAQFLCNRYPLNSKARKHGPHNTLNDVPVPVRPGGARVKLTVNAVDEKRALVEPYPFDADPLVVSYSGRLVTNRPYSDGEDFLEEFYKAERTTVSYILTAA